MFTLSALHAFSLVWTLAGLANIPPVAGPINAGALTAARAACHGGQEERSLEDQTADVLFNPIGLALFVGWLGDLTYPSDPSDPKPTGDPPSSGKDPPPVGNAPEPGTLVSGMIGAGLIGWAGWRRRRRSRRLG
jgi:hypothetical protein